MINSMKLEFQSKAENEAFARTAVAAFTAVLDPTVEELTEIKTGVSEAVSNAIIHAYGEDADGTITVECKLYSDRRVIIAVCDTGVGIADIEKAREPMFTTGRTEERSGMGFTVMESFMDKVEIESRQGEGTKITMYKTLDAGYDL